jgi:hypothetical protein
VFYTGNVSVGGVTFTPYVGRDQFATIASNRAVLVNQERLNVQGPLFGDHYEASVAGPAAGAQVVSTAAGLISREIEIQGQALMQATLPANTGARLVLYDDAAAELATYWLPPNGAPVVTGPVGGVDYAAVRAVGTVGAGVTVRASIHVRYV